MKPLPRGRHGLPREFVAANQRRRLLAAIAETLDEAGLGRDDRRHGRRRGRESPRATSTPTSRARTTASSPPTTTRSSGCAATCSPAAAGRAAGRRRSAPGSPRRWPGLAAAPDRGEPAAGRGLARRARDLRPLPRRGRELRPLPARGRRRSRPAPQGRREEAGEAVVGGIASLLGPARCGGRSGPARAILPGTCRVCAQPVPRRRRGAPHNLLSMSDAAAAAAGTASEPLDAASRWRAALAGAEPGDRGRMDRLG